MLVIFIALIISINLCRLNYQNWKPRPLTQKHTNGKRFETCKSSVHENEQLSDIDKSSYLRSMVKGTAKTTVSGFALTSANYAAALELLIK